MKICNIIDEYTRQHIGFRVDRKVTAQEVIETLDVVMCQRGAPKVLRMDNGPEFISKALANWAEETGVVQAFIPPGMPWHNGFVESLHNRMRDELLEDNMFADCRDLEQALADWSKRYNQQHPHSSLGYQTPDEYHTQWLERNNTTTGDQVVVS